MITRIFRKWILSVGMVVFSSELFSSIDLDLLSQDFVLEKMQIQVSEYPQAYNPSIVRWKNCILMSFRILSNPNNEWHSLIGLIWLDENFNPISEPQILNTRRRCPAYPSKSEDARLFVVDNRLYIIYNDNEEYYDEGLRRMYYSEVLYDGYEFSIAPEGIEIFEGASQKKWEKNWIPFDYKGTLLLAYSIVPHRIFLPLFGFNQCETVAYSKSSFSWPWGAERIFGGTPALKIEDQYLAFFHSSFFMSSQQSDDKCICHYFMGAYLFNSEPPFAITHTSVLPIVGKGLYDNPRTYKRVVFPGGFIYDENYIWIAFGREDCEMWVLKLDKKELLNSLKPVTKIEE